MKATNIFKRFSLWLLTLRLSFDTNIKNLEFSVSSSCRKSRWFPHRWILVRPPSMCLNCLLVSI